MVNPKTIDSVSATISKDKNTNEQTTKPSVSHEKTVENVDKPCSSVIAKTSAIHCQKYKKDTLMDAIDQWVI